MNTYKGCLRRNAFSGENRIHSDPVHMPMQPAQQAEKVLSSEAWL